ncbi:MAG: glutathione S-transferase family protein [Steroidobacteraceae bacterium]
MTIELYWGSGSPYSWRVQLALEYKRVPYRSHLLQFAMQEHKSPQMLKLNPRGRLPVLRDGEFTVFESLACLAYLDRKYPEPPLFGRTAEEAGTIMRVICEYQAYAESHLMEIVAAVFLDQMDGRLDEVTRATHLVAGEARTIEARLGHSDWLVGGHVSAADIVVFPGIMLLLRAMEKREAGELRSRFLPMATTYPAIARWIGRMESLPGYERTVPPHWRDGAPRG